MTANQGKSPEGNDDLKEKMRQALAAKQQRDQSHPTAEGDQHDGSEKMHGVAGHVDTQTYRRKSG